MAYTTWQGLTLMRVWLVTIGEPLPIGERVGDRLQRTGYFAYLLSRQGHNVVWWTSTFDHFRKEHLFESDTEVHVSPRLTLRLLHGCGYRSNFSFVRFRDHREVAEKFKRAVEQAVEPDIVLSAFPTVELSLACTNYGRERGIPVILDMRDMWPDIIVDSMPAPLRGSARVVLSSMFRQARVACSRATAITGITEAFVDWGVACAGRPRSPLDRSFPLGYTSLPPSPEKIREAEVFWDQHGVCRYKTLTVCYFGAVGRHADLETVVLAARKLRERGKDIRFVLCGTGDRIDHFRNFAADDPNVLFPGWVNAAQIYVLMRRSIAGIDPLPDRYDFLSTINNKAIEYLSAGLPVIVCPKRGVLFELLSQEGCGLGYSYRNPDELADVLDRLAADPQERSWMSENATRVFCEKFTAERVYDEMAEYLESIAGAFRTDRRFLP